MIPKWRKTDAKLLHCISNRCAFLGSRLLFNLFILYTAVKRNPEFLGYKRKLFPGQLPPRPQEIQPRRTKYPKDFHNDWKKIGSKRTKFDDLGLPPPRKYHNTLTTVESEKN